MLYVSPAERLKLERLWLDLGTTLLLSVELGSSVSVLFKLFRIPCPWRSIIDFVDERGQSCLLPLAQRWRRQRKSQDVVSKTSRQPESLNETSFKGMRSRGYCSLKIRFSSVRKNHVAGLSHHGRKRSHFSLHARYLVNLGIIPPP